MKHLYLIIALFALCTGSVWAQEYQPLLEEGKIWVVDNDVAGGDVYHIYNQYTANKERVIDGIQYWTLMESKFVDGAFGDPKAISDCFVGEKDGKLYFWNGGEQQAPVLFMDFSLTAGSSLDFKLSDDEDFGTVHMEVTAVGDTVFASSADRSRRRLLHVSYNGRTDVWVEGIGSLKYGITFPYYFGTTGAIQNLYGCSNYYGVSLLYQLVPKEISLSEDERRMVASNNDFAFNLLRAMREQKDTNIVLSPLSITFALGMLNNGASGQTLQEINQVLGFDDADAVNSFCRRMLTESNNLDRETTALIANTIFINEGQGYYLQQPFVEKAQTYYDATPEARNFHDGQTMDVINKWGSDHTMGMIESVLNESTFDEDAVSYLLNATYFKGAWANKFRKDLTTEQEFGKTGKKVPMMLQEDDFYYAEDEDCQYISLPYGNGAYSMTVFLPREDKTLGDVLSTLNGQNWKKDMNEKKVNLKLPRFETSIDARLNDIMQALGIRQAFSEIAEFPYFCNESVYIKLMKQSAKIKVDEEGSEAAGVTVIEMYSTGIPKTYYFHADRPFLYVISEQSTGAIFFIGQYLGESTQTGISLVPTSSPKESSRLFDLQGRRLTAEPQHGVFIKGGKKVMK